MEPATVADSKQHVPPCKVEEMTKALQAVVERYRKQQAVVDREQQYAKNKSVPEQTRPELVYSAEQRKALESLASVNDPVGQRDTVW